MKKMLVLAIAAPFGAWLVGGLPAAPAERPPACAAPEAAQFDFWVGEWDARWEQGGKPGKGTNTIHKVLGDCIVHEDFREEGGDALHGLSVSAWDPRARRWKQTWVDNTGSYLDFVGELKDGRMVLAREAAGADGKGFLQRMVWYNIAPRVFDWNWERSDDGGKTWQVVWKIAYARRQG